MFRYIRMVEIPGGKHGNKLVTILWFFAVAVGYYNIGQRGNAPGYEISLYSSYPGWLWILLFGIQLLPLYLIVSSVRFRTKRWGILGGMLLFFSGATVLLLPVFRGYFFYGAGDKLSHIGTIQGIIQSGHVGSGNFYPFLHIFEGVLGVILAIDLKHISWIVSISMFAIYFTSPYIFLRSLAGERAGYLLLIVFSPFLFSFYHLSNQPALVSFFIFPYLLFLLEKYRKQLDKTYLGAALPIGFALILGHPITTIVGISTILLPVVFHMANKMIGFLPRKQSNYVDTGIVIFGLLVFVSLTVWNLEFGLFGVISRSLLMNDGGGAPVPGTVSLLTSLDLEATYIIDLFLSRYGHLFFYYLLLGCALLLVLTGGVTRTESVLEMLFQLIFSIAVGLAFLLNPLVIGGIQRTIRWSTLFMTLFITLVSYLLYFKRSSSCVQLNRQKYIKKIFAIIFVAVIIFSTGISVMNVHQSPQIGKPNPQITEQRISGSGWLFEFSDRETNFMYSHANLKRISAYLGYSSLRGDRFTRPIPDRFGYQNGSLSPLISKSKSYLVFVELDKEFPKMLPESIRQEANQYRENDVMKLNNEPKVNNIYHNGEYEIYVTNGVINSTYDERHNRNLINIHSQL